MSDTHRAAKDASAAPSPRFDRRTQDIGNLVELGHLNIRVPDQQCAMVFYVMGLGLTRDPYLRTGTDNAWINVGTCQFHLPVGQAAQVLRGTTGLVMPDLDALQQRLQQVAPLLAGTQFAFERSSAAQMEVRCPWGNRIRVHAPDLARFSRMALGMPYIEGAQHAPPDVRPHAGQPQPGQHRQRLRHWARGGAVADGAGVIAPT